MIRRMVIETVGTITTRGAPGRSRNGEQMLYGSPYRWFPGQVQRKAAPDSRDDGRPGAGCTRAWIVRHDDPPDGVDDGCGP